MPVGPKLVILLVLVVANLMEESGGQVFPLGMGRGSLFGPIGLGSGEVASPE